MTPDNLILMINPLIKGELRSIGNGTLLFGRMWESVETRFIEEEVQKRGVSYIWNLLESSHGNIAEAEEIWSPVNDLSVPSDDLFVRSADKVLEHLLNGKTVLIHCHGGKGRTSMAIATILVKSGMGREEALNKAHQLANGPETEDQKNFVRSL